MVVSMVDPHSHPIGIAPLFPLVEDEEFELKFDDEELELNE